MFFVWTSNPALSSRLRCPWLPRDMETSMGPTWKLQGRKRFRQRFHPLLGRGTWQRWSRTSVWCVRVWVGRCRIFIFQRSRRTQMSADGFWFVPSGSWLFLKGKLYINPQKRFINSQKRFINSQKRFINSQKRFINSQKRFINSQKLFLNSQKLFLNFGPSQASNSIYTSLSHSPSARMDQLTVSGSRKKFVKECEKELGIDPFGATVNYCQRHHLDESQRGLLNRRESESLGIVASWQKCCRSFQVPSG